MCTRADGHRRLTARRDDGEGNSNSEPDACRATCQEASCGDGVVDTGEECDDANAVDNDSCADECTSHVVWSYAVYGPVATGVAVDSSDHILLAGSIYGSETIDAWISKLDPLGQTVWMATHDGMAAGDDRGYGVAVDSQDNVLVVGRETSATGNQDAWVGKYDPSGAPIWKRIYAGVAGGEDIAYRVATDPGDGIVVVGHETTAAGDSDIWVRKYDPAGGVLWTRTAGGGAGGFDYGTSVAVDAAGDVVAAGVVQEAGWLRKYDTDGATLWTQTYPDDDDYYAHATGVAFDPGGNLLAIGYEYSATGAWDVWVAKYDADGDTLWTRSYDGPGRDADWGLDIASDGDGSALVTGGQTTEPGAELDIWTAKYDAAGWLLWTRSFDGVAMRADTGYGVCADSAGNVLVVGAEAEPLTDSSLLWLTKYPP